MPAVCEAEDETEIFCGWLMVSEGDPMETGRWHAGYCIGRPTDKSLVCYRWEPVLRCGDKQIRLDGGRSAFSTYWNIRLAPQRPIGGFHTVGRSAARKTREDAVQQSRNWFSTVRARKSRYHDEAVDPIERRGWTSSSRAPQNSAVLTTRSGSAHNLHTANGSYHNGEQEDASTPQRLANFLSKPFRTNPLKRTKSVSKLEKQQQQQSQLLNRGDVQRSQENLLSLTYGSRAFSTPSRDHQQSLRSSRSHESLLNFGATTHMIDLGDGARIQPVHPSMHDVPNCFRVANTYYACRTPQERNRWMENLSRIVNPRLDMQRRVEHSLQLWVLEAKGVPSKKRYFCEFSLDREPYGKTTAKPRTDNVFWGEYFEFNMLRQNRLLTIDLYREGDLKKKKGSATPIGYVKIDIESIANRHPVEKWYTVTTHQENGGRLGLVSKSTPAEQPAIRIKARWQSVDILPLGDYDDLKHFLTYNYEPLCTKLEPILSVKTKEDLATAMVRVFHEQRMAKDFLCDLVMMEINLLDNDHLMFRGNSLATKAMEAYMKLVADDYLQDTLSDFTKELIMSKESCEVDPLKLTVVSSAVLEKNRALLMKWVEKAWYKMYDSSGTLPCELRAVFCAIRDRLQAHGRGELADTLISSSIFLRYLCPAILSPSLFNLCDEYPCGTTARNLTLIAKTLQNLANFTKFGGKEHYMEFMNSFVEREWHRMKEFLLRISTGPVGRPTSSADVNLGRELSLINTYLEESWTSDIHERASHDSRLVDLRKILLNLRERKRPGSQQSPLVHQASSDYENSPQQPVIRGRSENVPAYRSTPPTGQATVITRSRPAAHLMTNDDYVTSAALASNNHRLMRLSDEIGTSSSRTSEKTSSSGDAHDTDDSESELRPGRPRARKPKRKVEGSETSSLPPSSGYHSKEASNYSTSASSSPVERSTAVSISNPGFSPMKEAASDYGSYHRSNYEGYRRASPPPYDPERLSHNYSIYAVPPDCDTSPRTSKVQPRTNPRASRSSGVLRPTIVDIDMSQAPQKVEKIPSEVDIIEKQRREIERLKREKDEVEEQQKREIRRLMKENAELKRQMTETVKYAAIPMDKISDSGASEESYDSLSSLDRVRKSAVHC